MSYQNKTIKMHYILEPPHQQRMQFNEEALHQLAESMKQHGLINPITLHMDKEGKLTIIAGHRRYLAAKILKWKEIPARVKKDIDGKGIKVVSAVENLQRADLDIIEEADLVGDLHYEENLSIGNISDMLNRSKAWVQARLEVRQFPLEVLEALQRKTLKFGTARLIAGIQDTGFRKWILDMAENSGATEAMVQTWINDNFLTLSEAERQEIIETQSKSTTEFLEQTKFSCALCHEEDTLAHVMIIRTCKQCYLGVQAAKEQYEQEQRQKKADTTK